MHIQLLSFKIQCLLQRFQTISVPECKSTAASWNVTSSCLFLSLLHNEISPNEDLACTTTTSKHHIVTLNTHRFKLGKCS